MGGVGDGVFRAMAAMERCSGEVHRIENGVVELGEVRWIERRVRMAKDEEDGGRNLLKDVFFRSFTGRIWEDVVLGLGLGLRAVYGRTWSPEEKSSW